MFIFIEISRWRSDNHSSSRTFIRLFTLPYKSKAKQAIELVKIQSVLCEDAMCLKRVIVVWNSPLQRLSRKLFGMYNLLGFIRGTLGYNSYTLGYVQQSHHTLYSPDNVNIGNIWDSISQVPALLGM